MRAMLGDIVIAEAPEDELISIEGNWYFPPERVNTEYLVKSSTPYVCPWKGTCQYFSVVSGDGLLQDRAWSYPNPYPSSFKRVGRDYSDYVAFWKDVTVLG